MSTQAASPVRKNRKHLDKPCLECGTIYRPRTSDSKYCSRDCQWKNSGNHKPIVCVDGKKMTLTEASRYYGLRPITVFGRRRAGWPREHWFDPPLTREQAIARMSGIKRVHSYTGTRVFNIWNSMRKRCRTKSSTAYKKYGAIGIDFCDRWDDFENFLADMGEPPSRKHSLDRIDNDKGYFKENCRWATPEQQITNRRVSRLFDFKGERMTVSQIARYLRISESRLRHWLIKKQEPLDRAILKTIGAL